MMGERVDVADRRQGTTTTGLVAWWATWSLTEPRTAQRTDARLYRTPMVGRTAELTMVRSVFERCVADRRPQLVTVYGDAGVGKTRLVEEFADWTTSLPQPT